MKGGGKKRRREVREEEEEEERERERPRRPRLTAEEREMSRLERKLGMKRRKRLPTSFREDGLDCIPHIHPTATEHISNTVARKIKIYYEAH